jgi:hypothetical protein
MSQRQYHWSQPAISQRFVTCLIGAALLCIAASSFGDRRPGSLSTIKINATSGNVEIIHRLHSHDAELGVIAIIGDRSLTLDKLVGRAQLALYVEERFIIAELGDDGIGAPLDLELIGAEVDGESVLVYQEFKGVLPGKFAIRNDILRDIFPEQINHVNIATGSDVRSLIFKGNDNWLTVDTE